MPTSCVRDIEQWHVFKTVWFQRRCILCVCSGVLSAFLPVVEVSIVVGGAEGIGVVFEVEELIVLDDSEILVSVVGGSDRDD